MANYNLNLQSNNTDLQSILDTINALPDANESVELPELTNPGVAADLLISKELIDGDGNIVTGTMPNNGIITKIMDGIGTKSITIPIGYTSGGSISLDSTIDDEVNEQTDLIAQIKSAVDNLPEADSGDGKSMISVTISDTALVSGAYYFDENNMLQKVLGETKTVNVLSGIVFVRSPLETITASGNYVLSYEDINAVRFLVDGGTATIVT